MRAVKGSLATPLEGGIGTEKALTRDKTRPDSLWAGWVEYCAQLGLPQPPLKKR